MAVSQQAHFPEDLASPVHCKVNFFSLLGFMGQVNGPKQYNIDMIAALLLPEDNFVGVIRQSCGFGMDFGYSAFGERAENG